ncbi:MAG: AAA family ATPase [bacterium]|nr:AAA family ATPase [bacterium]
MFKTVLANLLFPKRHDNQSFIVSFIGVPGVGKSTLSHRLRSNRMSRSILGSSSALKLVETLNIPVPLEYKQVFNFLTSYPEIKDSELCKLVLLKDIAARIVHRNIYIDESILNYCPVHILEDFYNKKPDLFKKFFKSTFVIALKDTPENILKKVNKRIIEGKDKSGYYSHTEKENLAIVKNRVKEYEKKLVFLKSHIKVREIQASLPLSVKIKTCKSMIKQFNKTLSKDFNARAKNVLDI